MVALDTHGTLMGHIIVLVTWAEMNLYTQWIMFKCVEGEDTFTFKKSSLLKSSHEYFLVAQVSPDKTLQKVSWNEIGPWFVIRIKP